MRVVFIVLLATVACKPPQQQIVPKVSILPTLKVEKDKTLIAEMDSRLKRTKQSLVLSLDIYGDDQTEAGCLQPLPESFVLGTYHCPEGDATEKEFKAGQVDQICLSAPRSLFRPAKDPLELGRCTQDVVFKLHGFSPTFILFLESRDLAIRRIP